MHRPVLKYFGGKWKIAPWIVEHLPPHVTYVEPFGGAASVLMRKPRSSLEIYNDLDAEVVNVFRVLRCEKDAKELKRVVKLTPFAERELIDSYEGEPTCRIERARRVVVRSFMGLVNNSIHERHPYLHKRPAEWCNWPDHIERFTDRLQGVILVARPAIEVIKRWDSADTLFYVDPPYHPDSRVLREYNHELTAEDHTELAEVLHSCEGSVVMSGYKGATTNLYNDWRSVSRKAVAAGGKQGGVNRTELLWINTKERNQTEMF